MIKVDCVYTTTGNKYQDLYYDGTPEELYARNMGDTLKPIEFLYKKEDGKFGTVMIFSGVIESIYLAERATHLEQHLLKNGGKVYGALMNSGPASDKRMNLGKYKKYNFGEKDIDRLKDYYAEVIANEFLDQFKDTLDKIDPTAAERTIRYSVAAAYDVFTFDDEESIQLVSYFLTICTPFFIQLELEEDPDIFKIENDGILKDVINDFTEENKEFKLLNEEEATKLEEELGDGDIKDAEEKINIITS